MFRSGRLGCRLHFGGLERKSGGCKRERRKSMGRKNGSVPKYPLAVEMLSELGGDMAVMNARVRHYGSANWSLTTRALLNVTFQEPDNHKDNTNDSKSHDLKKNGVY
jgi:hypothetical protein